MPYVGSRTEAAQRVRDEPAIYQSALVFVPRIKHVPESVIYGIIGDACEHTNEDPKVNLPD